MLRVIGAIITATQDLVTGQTQKVVRPKYGFMERGTKSSYPFQKVYAGQRRITVSVRSGSAKLVIYSRERFKVGEHYTHTRSVLGLNKKPETIYVYEHTVSGGDKASVFSVVVCNESITSPVCFEVQAVTKVRVKVRWS